MNWIDKNKRMPDKHPEFEGCSKDVIVTDGKNWGHGSYSNEYKYWTYHLVGRVEQSNNNITHWAEPLVSPSEIEPTIDDMMRVLIQQIEDNGYSVSDIDQKSIAWELKTRAILEKFTDGKSKYKESALFHRVIEMLVRNQDPFDIIEKLLDMNADLLAKYLDYVQRDTRPMIIINNDKD